MPAMCHAMRRRTQAWFDATGFFHYPFLDYRRPYAWADPPGRQTSAAASPEPRGPVKPHGAQGAPVARTPSFWRAWAVAKLESWHAQVAYNALKGAAMGTWLLAAKACDAVARHHRVKAS